MRFESWYYLLILILVPIFFVLWKKKNDLPRLYFPVKFSAPLKKKNPALFSLILKISALCLFVFALARPQSSYQQQERKASGVDIILVMDLSASMNIEDLSENSRLSIAKETMRNFIRARKSDRIGFVVFSGEPFTMVPPTLDYGLLLKSIRDAETGVLKDGTAIGDGLALAVNRLRDSQSKSKVIILLTDGDNNVGQVDPGTAGELAAGYGIKVYTIAIGREGRVKLPLYHQTPFGQKIKTYQWFDNALNPELLKKIAEQTGGKFYRVTEGEALQKVFNEIDQLEKTELNSLEKTKYVDQFHFPVKLGLLLIVIEQLLSLFWWRLYV